MSYLNSRGARSKEKVHQEKEFLLRTKKYGVQELNMGIADKKKLIDKIKKILSKKYKLEDREYIILIDKFKLDTVAITKNTIEELISYLNMELKYNSEESLEKSMESLITLNETFDKNLIEIQKEHASTPPKIVPSRSYVNNTTAIHTTSGSSKIQTTVILDLLDDVDLINFEGNYKVAIKYKSDKVPLKIIIKDIILSSSIISKYNLDKSPYILMKIREFNNNIFINSSHKYYFTYFNIKNNTVSMSNKKTCIPDKGFSLSNLNISFYDHNETLIQIIDFNEKTDFFKIFLSIEF